jgi:nicotinate-nucleotide adenylyltransferase
MGGTFDPVHFGHLFIAQAAQQLAALDEVWWVPNNVPAHREGKTATLDADSRARLVQLAIADNPRFVLSRVELDRPGPSYAIDTVARVREELRARGHEPELFWIMGADALLDLPTWRRSGELLQECRFLAASRPGFDLEKAYAALARDQRERVQIFEVPGLHIASRELRARSEKGLPIRYLVPEPVRAWIEQSGCYRDEN